MATDKSKSMEELVTQEMMVDRIDTANRIKIGMVSNYDESEETRFFLTPEACGMLSSMGFELYMQGGASIDISYSDEDYMENDVHIVSRAEALQADIVLSVETLKVEDIKKMRKGSALMSLMSSDLYDRQVLESLINGEVDLLCIDNMYSANGVPIFSQLLDEIDGRAALMYAQEGLSFLGEGKGVLLGGVAGINPCEVLIIGSGWRVISAARAAISTGAKVTLMDNDVSALYEAQGECGERLSTASIHPRVLYNKVKSADVIILDLCTRDFEFPKQLSVAMKDSVYLLDLQDTTPSLSVPRTVAMAISNVLINFFNECMLKGGMSAMIASTPGVQHGVVTHRGALIDKLIGVNMGMPTVDLNMIISSSN